jgi:hypothetical protein
VIDLVEKVLDECIRVARRFDQRELAGASEIVGGGEQAIEGNARRARERKRTESDRQQESEPAHGTGSILAPKTLRIESRPHATQRHQ